MTEKNTTHGEYGPSKLTPEMHAKICDLARLGMAPWDISRSLRLGKNRVKDWLKLGESDYDAGLENAYTELYLAYEQAEAEFVQRLTLKWQGHFDEDWRAIEAFLKRRFPKTWGVLAETMQGEGGQDAIKITIKQEEYDAI